MISALSEQLSKQSLEDVNHPFTAPYQTRSKTRAQLHIQCLDDELSAGKTNVFDAPSVTVNDISPGDRPRSRSHTVGSSAYRIPQNSATASHVTTEDALSVTPPTAPPKKRHCRSMSAGEVTERNRGSGGWKPRASKVWRPLHTRSKPDGHQGHSPLSKTACFNYLRLSSHIPSSTNAGVTSTNISEYSTPPDSPVPRPVSATSWDGTLSANAPPFWLERFSLFRPVISPRTMHNFSSLDDRDRMSESSGSVTSVSSSRSDSLHEMELRNQKVVQRCKSQPCVPVSKRGAKKRRREEEARPKLDFYKMEEARFKAEEMLKEMEKGDGVYTRRSRATRSQAVMCKKASLRSAGRKCNPEEFLGLQTIASSPGETNNNLVNQSLRPISPESESNASSSVMITPTCSPTRDMASKDEPGCSRHRNVSKDDGYHGDSDCDLEEDEEDDLFPCTDLDLEAIEKH